MISMKMANKLAVAACCVFAMGTTTYAIPALQVYVEGADYDQDTETWQLTSSSLGDPFRVWIIGNVDGPGGQGLIEDVRIAFSYESVVSAPVVSLVSSTTGGYGGFTDPSVAGAATHLQTVTDGSSPTLGDESSLPSHGIYGAGTDWQEFGIGDFGLTDSPMADFIDLFPSAPADPSGQISVYDVSATNASGLVFHIDAYSYSNFAPFSHDGGGSGGTVTIIPAPGAALLACMGLGMIGRIKRRAG